VCTSLIESSDSPEVIAQQQQPPPEHVSETMLDRPAESVIRGPPFLHRNVLGLISPFIRGNSHPRGLLDYFPRQ
jgi:hypothetical protein